MLFQSSAIDNEELIHNAVRQGHLISLEIYLNQNPHCINKIYTYNQSKWTPLLAACYYKRASIVRMLLKRFQPDIEANGTVVFDLIDNHPEIVEDVSPLWTAAAVDQFDIVRLLVEHGKANINHLTKTHSTIFRVACFNNNLEMAKYLVEHGANPYQMKIGNYTNLMLSAGRRYMNLVNYLVSELGSDINTEDENGQTALYYAIKSGSTDIVKFLLENGASNIRDRLRYVTPLMRAALYGEVALVEVFQGHCSDLEWIEAKELLGATFGGCVAQFENRTKTIQYLTEAFQLRQSKNLPKIPSDQAIEIFRFRSECVTLEQFNQLIQSDSKDELHIETIRIHQRLLGDMSNDYHHVLRYYGAILADKNRYGDCLRWWFYEIDLKQKYKLHYRKEYLRCFIDIFNEIKSTEMPMESLIRMLKILDQELQGSEKNESSDYNLYTLLYLMTIIARIIFDDHELNEERRDLLRVIHTILRRSYQTNNEGFSLLHLCCRSSTNQFSDDISYPCWLTARLLIHCGVHIDVLDFNKNTPLHLLVQNPFSINVMMIMNILANFGAHFDHVNSQGQMPLELISLSDYETTRYLKEKIAVRRLKCICARLIQKQSLRYEPCLSALLIDFIQKH